VKKPRYVLDRYALLGYLQGEAMADQVEMLLDEAAQDRVSLHLSTVNLGEIAYIVERRHGAGTCRETMDRLAAFPVRLEEATLDRVLAAAHWKAQHALSYADAFALALAQELEASLVTGDPEFRRVESLVDIVWLEAGVTTGQGARQERASGDDS
jgi:predicted nucleic acid-binding protein